MLVFTSTSVHKLWLKTLLNLIECVVVLISLVHQSGFSGSFIFVKYLFYLPANLYKIF